MTTLIFIVSSITILIIYTGYIIVCSWIVEHAKKITMYVVSKKHFFNISNNSVAFASELLENVEEMFI